ncbi:MAG: response regulator [Holophagales bacterium]|jgi:signal transduction histidine kinase/CheY-like chemotaxis protein|nr:response regulator [Holophagales bacterium]
MKILLQRCKKIVISHPLQVFFIFSSVIVLVVSVYSWIRITRMINASENFFKGRMIEAAKRLSTLTTAEELDKFHVPSDAAKPEWKALRQKLIEFAGDADVKYAFYMRVKEDKIQYIVDNDDDEKTRLGIDTEPVYLNTHADMSPIFQGKAMVTKLGDYAVGWPKLSSAYAPIFDRGGKVAAICGVDVDDQELLNTHYWEHWFAVLEVVLIVVVVANGAYSLRRFNKEATSAKEANMGKSRFLARMSHEIRTPMNAVIGMSDLAIMNYGKPEGIEYIANIKQAGNNLLTIINGILDLSAVESGKLTIKKSPYRIAPLLSNVITIIKMRLDDNDSVKLSLDIDPNIPAELIGDETRVEEILMNLLSNAVKYTQKGFIKFEARGQSDMRGNVLLTFDVSDSGIGIRQEDLDAIFADFSRIENKYTVGIQGTGLGLAITRALCRMMGGDVTVKSEYEVGSTFSATIIQDVSDFSPMGAFVESSAPIDEAAVQADFSAPGFRVLIVDDIMTNLKVAEGLLAPYQMQVDTCLSGREAVALVQQKEYDLVLVDHMMPDMDGIETVAAIRALGENFKKLPMVAVTASVMDGMKDVFLNSGFNDYLSKPIEIPKLKALLERVVSSENKASAETQEEPAITEPAIPPKRQTMPEKQALPDALQWQTQLNQIDGLDTKKGMASTGGLPSAYRAVLEIYCRDARERFGLLNTEFAESDIKNFTTNVHALKSASASIGAIGLSKAAAALEAAGLQEDMEYIRLAIAEFKAAIVRVVEKIEIAIGEEKSNGPSDADKTISIENLDASVATALIELKKALQNEDIGRTDRLLADLPIMHQGPEVGILLSRVTELVLTSDFQEAARCIGDAIGGSSDT